MSSPRHSRLPLDRYEPLRTFGGVLGPPGSRPGPAKGRANGAPPSPADSVSEGVSSGYRVIQDYMRQGQSFAKAVWPATAWGGPSAADPQKMVERMFQYASDLATAWLEYTQTTMGMTGQMPFGRPPAGPRGAPPAPKVDGFDVDPHPEQARPSTAQAASRESGESPAGIPTISVDIASRTRAEVTVELKPGPVGALSALDLRDRHAKFPRISGVAIEADAAGQRVVVRLKVVDDQPPGVYSGLIVDDVTNLPRGTLAVRIFGEGDPKRP
jgi:hypothetical protein